MTSRSLQSRAASVCLMPTFITKKDADGLIPETISLLHSMKNVSVRDAKTIFAAERFMFAGSGWGWGWGWESRIDRPVTRMH